MSSSFDEVAELVGEMDAAAIAGARLIARQRDTAVAELGDWSIPAREIRRLAGDLDSLSARNVPGWLRPCGADESARWDRAWGAFRDALRRLPA